MNEIEAQKQFIQQRRQHFLSEERWKTILEQVPQAVQIFHNNFNSEDLELKDSYGLLANTLWRYLRASYTAGEPITELSPMLDEIINVLEISTNFWLKNQEALRKIGYFSPPMTWSNSDHYLKVLQLISACYLLQREDLLERLLNVILANAEDGFEPDSTIEDLFYYRFKERDDPDYVQFGEYAALLSNAMRDDDKAGQLRYLDTYLKDWYHEMVGMSDTEYQSHLDPEQNGFCGYWSFEAAAIAYLDDLDDTSLRQYPYYPKDMVDWAREQKQLRLRAEDRCGHLPLLLPAGTTAPFTGKYGVENFIGHEIMVAQGQKLPAGRVSAQYDDNREPLYREDTVWRLLQREDSGNVRFHEEKLAALQNSKP